VLHLILSRAFMGIGGALIMPATLSILTNGAFLIPTSRDPNQRPIDIPGAVLSVVTLGAVLRCSRSRSSTPRPPTRGLSSSSA
jgi:hypothetical protein